MLVPRAALYPSCIASIVFPTRTDFKIGGWLRAETRLTRRSCAAINFVLLLTPII